MDEYDEYTTIIADQNDGCCCDQDSGIDEATPSVVGDVVSSADEDSVDDDLTVVSIDNDSDDTVDAGKAVTSEVSVVITAPPVEEIKRPYPEDCPVVSANDAVAYYDVLSVGQRGRSSRKTRNVSAVQYADKNVQDGYEQVRFLWFFCMYMWHNLIVLQ